MSEESELLAIQQANSMLMEMRREGALPPAAPPDRLPWWEISPPKEFAGEAGSMRCNWCRNPFDRERRSLSEVEHLRRVLKIDMTTPFDPPICDSCYENVIGSTPSDEQINKIGTSNSMPSNIVLQETYG